MKSFFCSLQHRSFFSRPFQILAVMLAIFSVSSMASYASNSCKRINVQILKYYGSLGHDSRGSITHGVKVQHGGQFYYARVLSPLNCLKNKQYREISVVLCKDSDRWDYVTVGTETARVHSIERISCASWEPAGSKSKFFTQIESPFYYSN